MNKIFVLMSLIPMLLILFSCSGPAVTPSPVTVSNGTVERIADFPSKHVGPRHVEIWLPEGYPGDEKYAVLYLHDGQMLFDASTTWNKQEWGIDEVMGGLLKDGKIRKTIVVGIWNTGGRHAEYFPQKPFERLPRAFADSLMQSAKRNDQTPLFSSSVQSDNYLKFIVSELKPFIDRRYETKTDAANTVVAGSSMGGLISLYALCEYPDIFGGAACISTHWTGTFTAENNPIPDAFITYLGEKLPDPVSHKLYFDHGTETLDTLYRPFQIVVDSVATAGGFAGSHWQSLEFQGADHSEKSWRKRIHIPLMFLLGE